VIEAGEDPAEAIAETNPSLSTQFFQGELNKALEEKKTAKRMEAQELKDNMKRITEGASAQAHEAIAVSLEKSTKDGTQEQRQSALDTLKKKSKETWAGPTGGMLD
jgi:hypothetical protein